MFRLPREINLLAEKLVRRFPGAEVFLVGGGVRDLLLAKMSKDFDLLVRGVPARKLEAFLKTQGKTNLVGKSFGVFKLKVQSPESRVQNKNSKLRPSGLRTLDSGLIDIALPRTEHALLGTGAYRDFAVQSDYRLPLAVDLSRRDFTVNALAYNILTKKISDPFGGLKDLDQKIIRAVGQPEARLKEDYSRLLRAIRFAVQLDFQIEKKTWAAVRKLAKNINRKAGGEFVVPRETIAKELLKAFYANPVRALELLDQSGLLKELLPELLKMKKCPQPKNWHSEGDVWQHTVLCLQNLFSRQYQKKFPEKPSINLILATLFHDSGKPYTIQTPKKDHTDRIRFNDHDNFGAQLARKAGERLKLSAYKDSAIDCDPEQVSWLIAKHMLVVHGRVGEMKNTTLEKYFFSDRPGADLLRLIFVDTLATVPGKGEKYTPHYPALEKRVKQLARLGSIKKPALPAPILDGREIMKLCKIKPGPEVGRIILKLREEQLKGRIRTKAAAKKFIRIKN